MSYENVKPKSQSLLDRLRYPVAIITEVSIFCCPVKSLMVQKSINTTNYDEQPNTRINIFHENEAEAR